MKPLAAQRCFNHSFREAAARCTGCRHFFCRECVSDHKGRVVCAACLVKLARKTGAGVTRFLGAWRLAQTALAVVLIWFFFYLAGIALLSIPSSFHEGKLWRPSTPGAE